MVSFTSEELSVLLNETTIQDLIRNAERLERLVQAKELTEAATALKAGASALQRQVRSSVQEAKRSNDKLEETLHAIQAVVARL